MEGRKVDLRSASAVRLHQTVEKVLREDEHVKLLLQIGAKETNAALRAIHDSTVIEPMRQWFRSLPLRGCWYETLVTEEEIASVVDRVKSALTTILSSTAFRAMAIRRYLGHCRRAIQFIVESLGHLKAKKAQIVRRWAAAQQAKRSEVASVVRQLTILHRSAMSSKVLEATELGFELFLDEVSMSEIVEYVWVRRRNAYLEQLREARRQQALVIEATLEREATPKITAERIWRGMLRLYPRMVFNPDDVSLRELCHTLVTVQHAKLLDSITLFDARKEASLLTENQTDGRSVRKGIIPSYVKAVKDIVSDASGSSSLPVSFYHALLTGPSFRSELPLFVTLKELQRGEELSYAASSDPHDQRSVKQAIKIHSCWTTRGRRSPSAVKSRRAASPCKHHPSLQSSLPSKSSPGPHRTVEVSLEQQVHVDGRRNLQFLPSSPPPNVDPAQRRPASALMVSRRVSSPTRSTAAQRDAGGELCWSMALSLHKAACKMFRRRNVSTHQAALAAVTAPSRPSSVKTTIDGSTLRRVSADGITAAVCVRRVVPSERSAAKGKRTPSPPFPQQ